MLTVRLARVVVAFAQALFGQPLARSVGGGGDRAAPATARDDFDGAMVDRHGPRAFFLTSLKGEAVRRGQSPHEYHAHCEAMYKRALIFAQVVLLRSSCYSELTRRTAMARTTVEELGRTHV